MSRFFIDIPGCISADHVADISYQSTLQDVGVKGGCLFGWCLMALTAQICYKEFSQHTILIAMSYTICGSNLRAKLDTVINSIC